MQKKILNLLIILMTFQTVLKIKKETAINLEFNFHPRKLDQNFTIEKIFFTFQQ